MEVKNLKTWEESLMRCIRCAYCHERCPVFEELGWEVDGARGKLVIAYGLLVGDLEPSDYIAEKIFQCTFCKDCVERCSANVPVPDILSAARADLFSEGFTYEVHKQLLDKVNKSGNIFGKQLKHPGRTGSTSVLLGCRFLERENDSKRYLDVLEKLGIKTRTFDETCCGMPFGILGDKKGFAAQQDKFRKTLDDHEEEFICACTTCAFFIDKKYPDLKSKYIIQEIVDRLPEHKNKIKKLNIKVTYHDPCNVSRGLGMIDEPRWLLNEIGAELIEMESNGKDTICCGGGGGLMVTDQALSNTMAENRLAQAVKTGAEFLVTLCPTCELNLKNVAQNNHAKIEVRNVLDLVYDAF
jgi:Fe-S oxidoreductase